MQSTGKGSDFPVVFLELLLVFISGYTCLMFYLEEEFVLSAVSSSLTLIFAWMVLDRSVF
ncbi:MAG: hypothetical protein ACI9LV_000161 [Candidatus Nanohaloarchaea archaeon]|jgi:hypothetical protein